MFWAIRGGGGNSGVVTSFEFGLHEVEPMVQFGLFFWPAGQGPEVLRLAREITAAMPREINAVLIAMNAPPAPFVPQQHHFAPGYALLLTGFAYLQELSDPVIAVITEWVDCKQSPASALLLYRLDGAFSRAGDDQTAFGGGRSPRYGAFIEGITPESGLLAAERDRGRGLWQALRPHATGSGDGYINGSAEYSGDGIRGSYGAATYERLARIKAEYDPDNMFHLNANIPPAYPAAISRR